jgi:hypothetical protein
MNLVEPVFQPRSIVISAVLFFALTLPTTIASADTAVSPIIGVDTSTLDFGSVPVASSQSVALEVFNASNDPSSVLQVTDVTVTGEGFRLISGPTLPIAIPGDSTVFSFTAGFRPAQTGPTNGSLTITAANASNSPLQIPLRGVGQPVAAADGHFIIKFTPEAIPPGARLRQGSLESFDFACPDLADTLAALGVASLGKLFPWFEPQDVHIVNQFGEEVTLIDLSTIYVAYLADPDASAVPAVIALADHDCVLFDELNGFFSPDDIPNDQYFQDYQWNLHHTGQFQLPPTNADINAPAAWDRTHGSSSVWVALLDTGVQAAHVDLTPRVYNAPSFVPGETPDDGYGTMGHGTAVAGIIGATGDNQMGVAGTTWTTNILNVKVIPNAGVGLMVWIAAGMDWARFDGRADIINCSFSRQDLDEQFEGGPALIQALRNASFSGILTCASMGNDNRELRKWPAGDPAVMAVGALWLDGHRWEASNVPGAPPTGQGSNIGYWIDIVAPGGSTITTTRRDNNYFLPIDAPSDLYTGAFGGTSAAAPQAAGVAALLKSLRADLDGDDLKEILQRTATDVVDSEAPVGKDSFTGWGIARADTAMAYVSPPSRSVQHYQANVVGTFYSNAIVTFRNLDDYGGYQNIPDGQYNCQVFRAEADFTFSSSFVTLPAVWFRTSGTRGWRFNVTHPMTFDFLDETSAWAGITSVTNTGVSAETFIYRVEDQSGYFLGWVPEHYNNMAIAITAVGDVSPIGIAETSFVTRVDRVLVAPNPGPGRTSFLLDLGNPCKPSVRIYDLSGRLVRVLSNGPLPGGSHTMHWDGRDGAGHPIASGIYFWQLDVNEKRIARDKIVLTR